MRDISIIVAASENNCIGVNNTLPWRQSADLKHFKSLTTGHPIIMGRNTFDSIGKPLPGRLNIVVTRQQGWNSGHDCIKVAHSLEQAIELAYLQGETDKVFLIGGAQLYREGLLIANTVFLTKIHADVQGDAFFPELESDKWVQTASVFFESDEHNQHSYSFMTYKRSAISRSV